MPVNRGLLVIGLVFLAGLGVESCQGRSGDRGPVPAGGALSSPPPSPSPSQVAKDEAKTPEAREELPGLIKALKDPDRIICIQAIQRLGQLGQEAVPAVPELLKLMTASSMTDDKCGNAPMDEISNIGAAAVPALVRALGTKDNDSAVTLLSILGAPAIPALMRVLDEGGNRAVSAAAAVQGMKNAAAPAVPALVSAYHHEKISLPVLLSAIQALGPAAAVAAPELINVLRLSDKEIAQRSSRHPAQSGGSLPIEPNKIRYEVIKDLGSVGTASPDVVPALMNLLRGEDVNMRSRALEALEQIGPRGAIASGDLIRIIKDPHEEGIIRRGAVSVLGGIGTASPDAVPAIVEAVHDGNALVRAGAAMALGKIGPVAPDVVPALVEALRDGNADVRLQAVIALKPVGPGAAIATAGLVRILRDPHERSNTRTWAAVALGNIGPAAREAVPALLSVRDERELTPEVENALKKIQAPPSNNVDESR
jgi:HEAT repeat protein